MARLNLPKRTKQIEDAREVLLKNGFHSTVGGMTVQPLHKEQTTSNLRATARMGLVRRIVEEVHQKAAGFFQQCVEGLLPNLLLDKDPRQIEIWLCTNGYTFKQDGLTSVLLKKDRVIVSQTARVDPALEAEVIAEIKRQQEGAL